MTPPELTEKLRKQAEKAKQEFEACHEGLRRLPTDLDIDHFSVHAAYADFRMKLTVESLGDVQDLLSRLYPTRLYRVKTSSTSYRPPETIVPTHEFENSEEIARFILRLDHEYVFEWYTRSGELSYMVQAILPKNVVAWKNVNTIYADQRRKQVIEKQYRPEVRGVRFDNHDQFYRVNRLHPGNCVIYWPAKTKWADILEDPRSSARRGQNRSWSDLP